MMKQILSPVFKVLPLRLIEQLSHWKSNAIASRIVRFSLRDRDLTICRGVGAGLKFNSGSSNPDYALGTNEYLVQQALATYLKPGGIFYDIGANLGFFTIIGAKLVGSTGSVYAFEPVPENATRLRQNAQLNHFHNITVLEQAVSRSPGKGELLLTHHPGGATLTVDTPPPDVRGAIAIELVSIDELIDQQKLAPPTVVKIDVEGAEFDVLQGMAQTIKAFKPVIIYEIDDRHVESFVNKSCQINDFIRAFGYEVSELAAAYNTTEWYVGHTIATPL